MWLRVTTNLSATKTLNVTFFKSRFEYVKRGKTGHTAEKTLKMTDAFEAR
jgi:hypothetical protein